ncbi:MAG: UDP-3-O-acyl-N-acetylglucosamine deacetylase [Planctomycetota bacterium]
MIEQRNEHTIAAACSVSGRGYWSGREVTVALQPAPAMTGIRFIRSDLRGRPSCPAHAGAASGVAMRTNLARGPAKFQMVEHLMAALSALEIDNCLVCVDGEELPGLDGSALPYVEALQQAGLVIQASPRACLVIQDTITVQDGAASIVASPSEGFTCTYEYHLDYGSESPIRNGAFRIGMTPHAFSRQVASARTFVTEEQARQIRQAGHASHVTNRDLLVIGTEGPIENRYRYRDECVRHKVLDLIGDLGMVGTQLIGRFVSHRGGHRLNHRMSLELMERIAAAPATSYPFRIFGGEDNATGATPKPMTREPRVPQDPISKRRPNALRPRRRRAA